MSEKPELVRVGHVALFTPDLQRSLWFWRDVVGLDEVGSEDGTHYLRAWGELDDHTLILREGAARVDHIGWRARRPEDIERFAALLRAEDVEVTEVAPGAERGQGTAIRFRLPFGHRFEIYHGMERGPRSAGLKTNSAPQWSRGASPRRIDHVNIWDCDVKGVSSWLQRVLGMGLREYIKLDDGSYAGAWLGVSALSHDIAVQRDAYDQNGRLHHLAYALDDAGDVLRAADVVREAGIEIDAGPGRHGISQAIYCYVRDPGSGHRLELFSGGYLVLDPDWDPVEWTEDMLGTALSWWGEDQRLGKGSPMDESTEG